MINITKTEHCQEIATAAHFGQTRRDGVTPYIFHPHSVVTRLNSRDIYAVCVAWLHDVLEDTHETEATLLSKGVPLLVVDTVALLTKEKGVSYQDYLEKIKASPLASKVKIADMLANLSDKPTDRQILKYARGLLFLYEDSEKYPDFTRFFPKVTRVEVSDSKGRNNKAHYKQQQKVHISIQDDGRTLKLSTKDAL